MSKRKFINPLRLLSPLRFLYLPFRFWYLYIGRPNWTWQAWSTGVQDGLREPHELSSGMTYDCTRLNTVYDQGANFGQYVGLRYEAITDFVFRPFRALRTWWQEENYTAETEPIP